MESPISMNPFGGVHFFSGLPLITCRKKTKIRSEFKRPVTNKTERSAYIRRESVKSEYTVNNLKTEDERRKNKRCTRKRAAPHRCVSTDDRTPSN